MPTLSQRLRELDRRVLREDTLTNAAGWTRAMSRWWQQLGISVVLAAVIAFNVAWDHRWGGVVLLPMVIISAFQAGRMHTEHERALGKRTFMGRSRPSGID